MLVATTDHIRYKGTALPSKISIGKQDKVIGLTIINESCNYLLRLSEPGLKTENDAIIIKPGEFIHIGYDANALVKFCKVPSFVEVADTDKLRDCDGNILPAFRQAFIIKSILC